MIDRRRCAATSTASSTTPLAGAAWGGNVKDSLFAPKIGANYELADGIALYAN